MKKYNDNPITSDTVQYICLWHKEGESINEIAAAMYRKVEDVQEILRRAMATGYCDGVSKMCADGYHGLKMKKGA